MTDVPIPKLKGYQIGNKIGSGAFADVFKATRSDGARETLAIKCVLKSRLSKSSSDGIVTEIKLLKEINHRHVVKLKDFAWDDNYIYLMMEYCSGGDLSHFIKTHKRLSESVCQRFLQQMASALQFLRSKNISHFDLKPQNIFLASKQLQILKIGDFGLAQFMSDTQTNTYIKGSPLYMAPEIIIDRKYDVKADIWSVGVILYECLFGHAPFSSPTFEELLIKIKTSKNIKLPPNASISSNCKDLLNKCLQRDPCKRIDFNEFFNHPFVDVKHAPSDTSIDQANDCIAIAQALEEDGKVNDAYNHYNDALKYLTPVMYIETNPEKRSSLKKTIRKHITHLETIKSSSKKETPDIYNPFQDLSEKNELKQLAKSTPNMSTALEICETAELYLREGKYQVALENYETGLGRLLELISSEPPGRRKSLLMKETQERMNQAEYVKKCGEPNFVSTNSMILPEAEAEKPCMLQ